MNDSCIDVSTIERLVIVWLMTMLFSVSVYAQSEPTNAATEKWFRLEPTDVYVDDFSLRPSETRQIEIATDKPLSVGLKTDASMDLKRGNKYVRLTQKETPNWLGTLIGASRVFNPTDGKLTLLVKNETDAPLQVVIFKKPPNSK